MTLSDGEAMFIIPGAIMVVLGFVLLISGYITPIVSQSKTGMAIGAFLLLGSIIGIAGIFTVNVLDAGFMMIIAGPVIIALGCLAWPCICCQGSKAIRSQVIGIASAHDQISMVELSNITGASVKLVSEIVYDAIGKRELSGRMEGGTFVRSAPSTTTYSAASTTREREIVKVLVICPYCGAKTEQGIGKCQNCQADL
ncbi:hypothetical protein EU528_07865 [Candidatus Thorarchaeota archaeon]|nr:MAG: hypothetical protein EU528_07865 [Candidatus Thorarchaeota archaeon]